MRLLMALPLALLLLLAAPSEAFACSCNAFTPVQLAREAEVIFTGVPRSYVMDVGSPGGGATIVEFDVERVFKGRVSSRVRIEAVGARGAPGQLSTACGWGFALGRRYTVFARDYDGDGTPNTNGCLRNVEGVIAPAEYGLPSGDVPDTGDPLLGAAIGSVALLGFAALAVALERRRTSG
ncbi:MAG TPA: hypothetical protein VFA01_01280 [Candidatus Dormibacteraeota bacterium]|nr:hypothetical protein [Candidatus Dormibacteraeota bacterium]